MVIGTASTFEPSFNIGSFENRMNVGIVGGGTGGVVAGMALERAGISVAVYERAPKLQEVGAGMMLWPNATRVLKDLRVLDHVAARSGPNTNFLVRSARGRVLMNIALERFDVPALCTRRADLLERATFPHQPIIRITG